MPFRSVSVIGLALALATLGAAPTAQQTPLAPFDVNDAAKAIERLATLLEENFFYPDVGKAYATMLRGNLAGGAYAKFDNASEFAARVTTDLQRTAPEGHLRVFRPGSGLPQGPSPTGPARITGVGKAGWLSPGVAYMSLHGFTGPGPELTRLEATLDELSSATTFIVDARRYLGGWVRETDIMFSYFFSEPTTMLAMETRLAVEKRGGSPLVEGPALRPVTAREGVSRREQIAIPSEKAVGLKKAQIFVLTSRRTVSGGEHFCLAMKRTKRGTLIGETTMGAGHFGGVQPLGGGYAAFIPVGRTIDPITNQGWEGTGVAPDIQVPAAEALDEALRRAGVDVAAGNRVLESLN